MAYNPLSRIPLLVLAAILLGFTLSSHANAQTATYHFHNEASSTSGLKQLKTAGPDAATVALTTVDLKNLATGEYLIKAFDTQSGVPNVSGVIPASSTITFTLWMKKTANVGTMFPRAKLNLNSAAGTSLCTSTGTTALTTTLTKYTLNCTTSANIPMTTSDRFYLWVGVNLTAGNTSTTFQGSLNVEGTLNGNYDSLVIVTLPITPPSISGLSVTSGTVGTSVTTSGANFGSTQGTSTLTFNGVAATPTSWGAGSIVAPVPAAATTGPVVVAVKGVPSNGVTFTVKPKINTLTPTSGAVASSVTIAGTTFGATQGTSTVTFNGTAATPTSWSATSIAVPVPTGATTGPVVVTVSGQASNGVTFTVKPKIDTLTPSAAGIGTSVTIAGTTFGATQGTSTVTFNGTAATPTSWSATSIAVPVPTGAATGPVVVTVSGQASNGVTFTVTPKINTLTPSSGAVATSVTIAGTTFGATQGTSTVTFNGTTATPTSWSATSIAVPVPTGATTGPVVVTVSGQASNGVTFTVKPKIDTLTPSAAGIGTSVTIAGTTFGATQGTSTVTFNGTTATPTSWSATSIAVPVPTGATTGPVVVAVSGQASNGVTFTVTPKINTLTPSSGLVGTSVTIAGTTFGATQGTSTVTFNGTAATPTSWSATSIAVPVPAGATTGPVVVTVGGQASNGVTFTVNGPMPSIGSLSPTSGPVATAVTISGSNFGATQGTSTVAFNGTTATPTSWSATSIAVPVPAGATSGQVVVTVAGQASNGVTFTVTPKINNLSPSSGAIGSAVTISGSTFGAAQGGSTVAFNGIVTTPTSWNATSIVAPVPAGASTGPVVVTVAGAASNGATFTVAPGISGVSPSTGQIGATITVTGSNFGATQGTSTIAFNGTTATPSSWSNTSIIVSVPAGASTGSIVATVGGLASNGMAFTVIGTGSISGTVTRASDSAAVSGAFVEVLQSGVLKASANTGPTGTYAVSGLVPGTYDVHVSAYGYATAIQNGNSVAGGSVTTINASLAAAVSGTLSGKITQADGLTPISGASVKAYQNTTVVGTVTTNATGDYIFNAIFPGVYTVEASAATYATRSQSGVTITATQTTTADISLNATPTSNAITYQYDELGRLIGVVDPAGDAATYAYDAVGNLLSISRQSASQLTIVNITPNSGPVGTTVTITGTGFHAIAGENTVTFNGTAATVSSASTTQIVVTVPAGATTGLVTVTTAEGSVSSSAPFTVGASAVPTISGFTPVIGTGGTGVTIVGTNFDPLVSNNTVTFGGSAATVNASTSTNISTTAPNAGSGRITVTTPNGTAVSSIDFFNVPAPHTAGDVDVTGRIGFGETKVVAIDNQYRVGLLLFDGTAGQRISLNLTGVTFFNGEVAIFSPTGLYSADKNVGTSGGLLVTTLQETGTYTILVDPDRLASDGTGSATLTLNEVPADINANIVIDGPAVPVTITTPGQNINLSFSGVTGQLVILNLSSVTIPTGNLYIFNPDGSVLTSTAFTSAGGFVDVQTLPATGNYTILIMPEGLSSGNATVTLATAPSDLTGTITVGGAAVPVTINTVGQNARFTFSGAAAQRVTLNVGSVNIPWSDITILNPDASTMTQTGINPSGGIIDIHTLPTTGTYTVVINPRSAYTGSMSLSLSTSAADGHLAFAGTIGRRLNLKISNLMDYETLTLTDPNAVTVDSIQVTSGAGYINRTLLANGTYNANVTPLSDYVMTVSDAPPSEFIGDLIPGYANPVYAGAPNVNFWRSFSGTAGQKKSMIVVSNITIANMTVYSPDGTVLLGPTDIFGFGQSTLIDAFSLPLTGTYLVLIDPFENYTGDLTINFYDATEVTRQITPGGASVNISPGYPVFGFGQTTRVGQNARVTFDGLAGQRVSGVLSVVDQYGSANISLLKPDGSTLAGPFALGFLYSGRTAYLDAVTLPVDGTYTIFVDPPTGNAASAVLSLYDVPPDPTGTLTINGSPLPVAMAIPGQRGLLSFSAVAGQHLNLNLSNVTTGVTVTVRNPDGTSLVSTFIGTSGGSLEVPLIPTSGTYTVLIDPQVRTGFATVGLAQIDDATGAVTIDGPAVPLSITAAGMNAQLTFTATAGDHLSLSLSNVTIGLSNVSIYKPDRTLLIQPVGIDTSGGTVDIPFAPASGTYTILVDPSSTNTGSMTVTLARITDVSGTVTIGGGAVPVSISTALKNARITFTATAAQHLKLQMSSVTISSSNVSISRADGTSVILPAFIGTGGGSIDIPAIPATGTYTILIDPYSTNTGNMTLTLTQITDVNSPIVIGGAPVTVTTTNGQNAKLPFSGSAGQKVSLTLTAVTISQGTVSIFNPDWSLLGSPISLSTNGGFLDGQTLPSAGTYNILVDPQGTATGHATLTLYNNADVNTTITPGGAAVPVTFSAPGQNATLTFSGVAGQRITLLFTANTVDFSTVMLLTPTGAQLLNTYVSAGPSGMPTMTLPVAGTYTLILNPDTASTGSMTLQITNP